MLKLKVIGAGAAGNKAAIELIKSGFDKNNVVLINSTLKDIPDEFAKNAIVFGSSPAALGGCGKERSVGKDLFVKDLRLGKISIENFINPEDTNICIVVSSTEGGTGSAITPIISKYISTVIGIPVIAVLLFGFNSDVRGMQNSIEISQDLESNYGIIAISNDKFLDEASNNKIKAEILANKEFARIVRIISGQDLKSGKQNIDDTDLYKLVATPGYMMIGSTNIKGVKNIDSFNSEINKAIDETKLIDGFDKSCKRIGAIFNIPESMEGNVDLNAKVLSERFGVPYELFTHVQNEPDKNDITWISTGLNFPIESIKEIYENYKKASSAVKKTKDTFFDDISTLSGNAEDGMFDMIGNSGTMKTSSKDDFLSNFN